jgi:hypothetical protein
MGWFARLVGRTLLAPAPARPATAVGPACALCGKPFEWNDAWRESYDPNRGETHWSKSYCPHCGAVLALDLGDGWSWHGANAAANAARALPPSALVPWGRWVPAHDSEYLVEGLDQKALRGSLGA